MADSPEVAVLGPIELRYGGQRCPLGGRLPRSILALLALDAGRTVSTGRLIELWDEEVKKPELSLKTNISRLRAGLPPKWIEYTGHGYRLAADTSIDSHKFEATLSRARGDIAAAEYEAALEALYQALELWRGPAFDDVVEYSAFVAEAARLDELHLQARSMHAEALLMLGRSEEAVADLTALTQAHPLQESLWELNMLALHRSGRVTEALRTYQAARGHLADHGVTPSPALQRLEQAILTRDPILDEDLGRVRSTAKKPTVFIAHGHDNRVTEATARALRQMTGTEPVILHEQPDNGATIIEKFEDHARAAGAAVVILSRADIDDPAGDDQLTGPRGRRNVIFELGYLVGALGRNRVITLLDRGVEIPSNLTGIPFIQFDDAGAWRYQLGRELRQVGVDADLNNLRVEGGV